MPYGHCYDRAIAQNKLAQDQFSKALSIYEDLLTGETNPDSLVGDMKGAAYCCSRLNQHDKALEYLQKAQALSSTKQDRSELYYRIGIEHGFLRNDAGALQCFRKSISSDIGGPYHAMSLQAKSSLERFTGDRNGLNESYREYQKYFPKDPYLNELRSLVEMDASHSK